MTNETKQEKLRTQDMNKEIIIVESPAKARTIESLLGQRYAVRASVGHVRDLPKSSLGVQIEDGFKPHYVVPKEKQAIVKELKQAVGKAPAVYLATDPDREGEAISWHLVQATGLDDGAIPVHRIVFHELTQQALEEALRHPRDIDMNLVNSQQARRILDRLVGYKLSPFLWRKVRRGLSAGRVQSVALRLVVDREREIEAFVPQEYWTIEAQLARKPQGESFTAKLRSLWGEKGELPIATGDEARALVHQLEPAEYRVSELRRQKIRRQPLPPFTTSTLQQEASRRLHFTAQRTMAVAQQLYEGLPMGGEGPVGLITYMRTDSTQVAPSAIAEARAYIGEKYGADFLPGRARRFQKKAKGAQEAHEAIRPTSVRREPASLKRYLSADQFRLYELIWQRMVASQMSPAIIDSTSADIEAKTRAGARYLFRATGSKVEFLGYRVLYRESDDGGEEEKALPALAKGDALDLLGLTPGQHFTQPPPRYSEATLVKALEEHGIGRPSTYAPIISTLVGRDYVERAGRQLHPKELGKIVSDLLSENFPDIMDIGFTAQMEDELDDIARGGEDWVPMVSQFYQPLEQALAKAESVERVKVEDEATGESCDLCGRPLVKKQGRYGPFIACSGYPECKNTKPLLTKTGARCPECGGDIVQRRGKKGRPFYGCSRYPECNFTINRRPLPDPCPQCGGLLAIAGRGKARCTRCDYSGPAPKGD